MSQTPNSAIAVIGIDIGSPKERVAGGRSRASSTIAGSAAQLPAFQSLDGGLRVRARSNGQRERGLRGWRMVSSIATQSTPRLGYASASEKSAGRATSMIGPYST